MAKTWSNIPEKNYIAEIKDSAEAKGKKVAGKIRLYMDGGVPGGDDAVGSISMTVDPNTYVMTTQLKNKKGEDVGSPAVIDLPLESMVVGGDYYTKTQTDTLLAGKQDVLTAGQNIQIENSTISATDTTYTAGAGLNLTGTEFSVDVTAIATQSDLTAGLATKQDTLTAGANIQINNNTISATDTTYPDFTGTDGTTAGAAGLVPAPATTDAGKFLKADGTWDTAGSAINVVQSPGTSRTDVMSQYAATKLVYPDYSSTVLKAIKITGSTSSSAHSEEVTIGYGVSANAGRAAVGVGYQANNNGNRSVAIGNYARATADGSIAIGEGAYASTRGEMNIGTSSSASYGTSYGYNNTAYRLLTGLYDPQNDHDAATKGYVDTAVAGAGAATFTTNEWNALWA